MELLDRYLHAVHFWLPKGQQEDILAELSDDLRSEVEEQEAALGRTLTEGEQAELLKRRGDPMQVASRYLPQRYVIGPALFPLSVLVLKILAGGLLVVWILDWVWIGFVLVAPGHRAEHPGWTVTPAWPPFFNMAFVALGLTTALFAVMERTGVAERWRRGWDPRKMPVRRHWSRIPRASSVVSIALGVLFILWWVQLPWAPAVEGDGTRIGLVPVWPAVYWLILGLTAAGVGLACANLLRPWWTPVRAAFQLALHVAGLVPVALLLPVTSWVEVASTRLRAARSAEVAREINLSVRGAVLLVGLLVLVACAQDVVRLVRLGRLRP